MKVQRFHYLAGIAFGALLGAAPVHAQESDNSHDIIVTANKRPERLQDVANSVSVVTGSQLLQQHLTSLSDYARTIPGLNIGNGGSPANSQIILRGIVPNGGGAVVGTYIDDSPVGSSGGYNFAAITALDLPPYELQQIEVLRGPQGTLYGAGAMGGLVKYELTPASTTHFSLQAGADVGAVADAGGVEASGRAAINVPLIKDVLGIRVSGFENHKPGYVDNVGTGQKNANSGDSYGGRVALQFTPTDTFSAKANAFLFRSKYDDLGWVTYTNPTLQVRSDNAYIVTRGTAPGGLTTDHNFPDVNGKNLNFFSLNMEWKPGPVNVVSATSWAHSKYHASLDETLAYGAYLPLLTGGAVTQGYALGTEKASLNKLVQELRVSSPDGPHTIEWMIGGFYTHEKAVLDEPAYAFDADRQPITSLQPYIARFKAPSTYQEEAVFGNLTWHITDRFDVAGGVRYAHNNQKFTEYLSGALYGGGLTIPGVSHEGVATWMADARYHFSKDVIAYARVATGYRPGGSNALSPGEVAGSFSSRGLEVLAELRT